MAEQEPIYLEKAVSSLTGAESEFISGRFDNAANRCYYSVFQAAIVALLREGIRPASGSAWSHAFVQGQFAGVLVNRRHRYPPDLRDTLPQNLIVRQRADYEEQHVSQVQADRSLRRTRTFLDSVQARGETA